MPQELNFVFSRVRSFLWGLKVPYYALRTVLAHPSLILWSIIPVLVTLVIYAYGYAHLQSLVEARLSTYWALWGISAGGWIATLVIWITRLLLFILSIVTFSFVSTIVACPFNDFLAERTELYTAPALRRLPTPGIGHRIRGLVIDLMKSALALTLYFFVLFLSWIPLFNFFTVALVFLITTFQYISYPQTRRGQGVSDGVTFLTTYPYACLGFGVIFSCLFSVPVVSAFCQPLAVVGGTLLFARAKGSKTLLPLR